MGRGWGGAVASLYSVLQRFVVSPFGLAAESMCRVADGNKASRAWKVAHLSLLEAKEGGREEELGGKGVGRAGLLN